MGVVKLTETNFNSNLKLFFAKHNTRELPILFLRLLQRQNQLAMEPSLSKDPRVVIDCSPKIVDEKIQPESWDNGTAIATLLRRYVYPIFEDYVSAKQYAASFVWLTQDFPSFFFSLNIPGVSLNQDDWYIPWPSSYGKPDRLIAELSRVCDAVELVGYPVQRDSTGMYKLASFDTTHLPAEHDVHVRLIGANADGAAASPQDFQLTMGEDGILRQQVREPVQTQEQEEAREQEQMKSDNGSDVQETLAYAPSIETGTLNNNTDAGEEVVIFRIMVIVTMERRHEGLPRKGELQVLRHTVTEIKRIKVISEQGQVLLNVVLFDDAGYTVTNCMLRLTLMGYGGRLERSQIRTLSEEDTDELNCVLRS